MYGIIIVSFNRVVINTDRKIVKLTNKPVSDEMQSILERLDRREDVPIYEIEDTPEIKTARLFVPVDRQTIERRGREEMQYGVYERMMSLGSAVKDENGKAAYEGEISRNTRLDIVIGLSASGKSSALVDVLSEEFKSRVIDNDMAKSMIPEFNDGWGAGLVHKESQMISDQVFMEALRNHENIVTPRVGSDPELLLNSYIIPAKEEGYEVNVHFVDVDRNKAMGRLLGRFITKGRFLDPKLIDKYAPTNATNKVSASYEALKGSGYVDGFSKWNNDVTKGEKPILEECGNISGRFIDNARIMGGDINHGYESNSIDAGNNGRHGQRIGQELNVDKDAQERVGQPHAERTQPCDEHTVSGEPHRRPGEGNDRGTDIGTVGESGDVSLTDEDLKGIPFDNGNMEL